jgi:hypothetical protein
MVRGSGGPACRRTEIHLRPPYAPGRRRYRVFLGCSPADRHGPRGLIVSGIAFVGVAVVFTWRVLGHLPSGRGLATIALSVLFLGGVQLLTIGVLGEYIARIFAEVKGRPVAVVAEEIGLLERPEAAAAVSIQSRASHDHVTHV